MIIAHKQLGETPLECLERIRKEQPKLAGETLSYAGRLDPMAEGVMTVLVGEEENRPENREKFLSTEKEYVAVFLVGVKTDTGDCLGLVEPVAKVNSVAKNLPPTREEIQKQVQSLLAVTKQTYPWFSGKTVDGIKLFDHYKAGNTSLERPSQEIRIKEVELRDVWPRNTSEVRNYIFDTIAKVHGDFRQKEICDSWNAFFISRAGDDSILTFEIRLVVSSGTFIRALTENFGFPATLYTLKRTRILPASQ